MSYEPTVWKDGDLVTSAKLNKLEQGVANGGGNNVVMGVVDENDNLTALNSTWQEIWDNNCTIIYVDYIDQKDFYNIVSLGANNYSVTVAYLNGSITLYAENANDYPTNTESESGGGEK